MNRKIVVAFSGGKTSAYMAHKIKESEEFKKDELIFVFANTGREKEATLEFVEKCDKYFGLNCVWLEAVVNPESGKGVRAKIVNFNTASRHGEPFEQVIKKHGIPNKNLPFCTRELKTYVINAYLRDIGWRGKEFRCIGIRNDEVDRVNPQFKKERILYPLISDFPTTRLEVNAFWANMPFTLNLKGYEGNCDFCFKKSNRKLLTLAKENQEGLDWWSEMESLYKEFVPDSRKNNPKFKPPIHFFRGNKSAEEIRQESIFFSNLAEDDSFDFPENFVINGINIDEIDGCSESCEAF